MYTIITENDESAWKDETGILYHFPNKYRKLLQPGTNVIYYKGTMKNKEFLSKRLSKLPHYFAIAKIGKIYPDRESNKGDLFATITNFMSFSEAILAKNNSEYLEIIPNSRKFNYWYDGVRGIDQAIYNRIVSQFQPYEVSEQKTIYHLDTNLDDNQYSLESSSEGQPSKRYITTYERNPKYRSQAIAIHGNSCFGCGFNFGKFYGEYAEGYIHVHHVIPVSDFEAPRAIDPETDLAPLCANCHSVIHRKKDKTLSIAELKELIANTNDLDWWLGG